MLGHTTVGKVVLTGAHAAVPNQIDLGGVSVAQMAEHSTFLDRLNRRPLPAGLKATSIAAREDLVVPGDRAALAGAHNVTVSAPGHVNDHGRLPGSAPAQREIALGITGHTPTCQSFSDAVADVAVSELIYATETGLAGGAWMLARRVDRTVGDAVPSPTIPRRYD